jgi:TonB family protein
MQMSSFHRATPLRRGALLCCLLALASAAAARAQGSPVPAAAAGATTPQDSTKRQHCAVIADTARGIPSAEQVRERVALRDTLVRIGHRFGVAQPTGLLLVGVDTGTMRGSVRFLETNLPQTAVDEATRLVERYLSELAPGRGFQTLVRIDGEYPAPAPGKRLCQPAPANEDEVYRLKGLIMDHHPDLDRERPTTLAVLRLVVNRAGEVAYVNVEKPTGDAFYDRYLPDLARHMRFYPALLNGQPFDTRIRFTLAFDR